MKQVLKWSIPVDDQRHLIGAGPVVHVECQNSPDVVQVWTEERVDDMISNQLEAQVYGTGHTYPEEGIALGSAVTGYDGIKNLVWHVIAFPQTRRAYFTND